MQSKSLTTLTAVLFFSASSLMASTPAPSCGGCKYVDGAAKVGGLAALTYFTVKGASCLYKYGWKKAPSTQAQVDALRGDVEGLKTRLGKAEGNQGNVMNAVFGTEGHDFAPHFKSKGGLLSQVAAGKADSEFSDAYASALASFGKAKDEAAAKAKADAAAKAEADAKAAADAAAKK